MLQTIDDISPIEDYTGDTRDRLRRVRVRRARPLGGRMPREGRDVFASPERESRRFKNRDTGEIREQTVFIETSRG